MRVFDRWRGMEYSRLGETLGLPLLLQRMTSSQAPKRTWVGTAAPDRRRFAKVDGYGDPSEIPATPESGGDRGFLTNWYIVD